MLLLTSVAFVVGGLLVDAGPVIALGGLFFVALPAAYVSAELSRAALRRTRASLSPQDRTLTLALWHPSSVEATLTLPSGLAATELIIIPQGSENLRIEADVRRRGEASPTVDAPQESAPPPHRFTVTGVRLGDGFIHGFIAEAQVALGLFSISAWVKAELTTRTLPPELVSRSTELRATQATESQSDLVLRDRRGFGMEIRELRDFMPGDPFKHIAWRASARRGKLISREFESDRSLSVWLTLDTSASMWWGPPGRARIDHALLLACDLARALSRGRDRVGLIVHDHTTRLVVEPGRGPLHLARMMDALLEVPHLVFEDVTEVTEREVVEHVARWWLVQEGRSFPSRSDRPPTRRMAFERPAEVRPLPRQPAVDVEALAKACQQRIAGRARRRVVPTERYAVDPSQAILRAFARDVGLVLPRDPTPRPGGQAQGLEAALSAVLSPHAGRKSSSHTIVALTDLMTGDDPDALRRVAVTARRHRHSLIFVLPVGERAELPRMPGRRDAGRERLTRALLDIQELRADEVRRAAQAILKPAGATFMTMQATDSPALILARLQSVA